MKALLFFFFNRCI